MSEKISLDSSDLFSFDNLKSGDFPAYICIK